jgi:hypothetical protein
MVRRSFAPRAVRVRIAVGMALGWMPLAAAAQTEGGLYVADGKFTFVQAAEQALARNRPGARFFVLALPPASAALTTAADRSAAAARTRVVGAGGVPMVCRRDLDSGAVDRARLVPGVVAVRGFPPAGAAGPAPGERHFADEDPAMLPKSDEALRRLRSACA